MAVRPIHRIPSHLEFIVMSTIRTLSAAFILATLALTAIAQTPPAAGASMPMMGGEAMAMPHDCAKGMAKHDHGAERGSPRPKSADCGPAGAAAAPEAAASGAKAKQRHDHSKFHKNM